MERNGETYYYEREHGCFHLMEPCGGIEFFRSYNSMLSYVPPSALLIEVTSENWNDLYEAGVFNGDH